MASTVKLKDLDTGNIITINHDPSFTIEVTVPDTTTEWSIKAIDPIHNETVSFMGGREKRG